MAGDTYMICILFSRSNSIPSRIIRLFAGGEYTHVSLGVDGPRGPFYTFARKYPRLPLPGGLIQEVPGRGFFGLHPNTRCCLFVLEAEAQAYYTLAAKLKEMWGRKQEYHYSLLGTITSYFHIPLHRQGYYFCSQFVAEALAESGIMFLDKDTALARPMDLYALMAPREPAMKGVVGDLEQ